MRNFAIIALCLSLIGCAHLSDQPTGSLTDLQYGMTQQQVIALLGKPESIEIYQKTDQTRMEFYIYLKEYASSEEKVPVCLIDKKVVGWGKTFYEDHISSDDVRIR